MSCRWLFAAPLLLVACGGYDGPEVGTVIEHRYDDADTYVTLVGKVPVVQTDDEHFYLRLRDGEEVGDYEVSETTYDEVRDGQRFDTRTGEVVPS